MSKFKRSAYTIMLLVTCLIASPVIIRQIWRTSAEKNAPAAPPAVSTPQSEDPAYAPASETSPDGEAAVQAETPTQSATEPEAVFKFEGFVTSGSSYFDDALFIGDSRTVGLQDYGTLQNADYFCSVGLSAGGIDDETIDGRTFDDVINGRTYGKVYIMLGVNEVGNDPELVITQYRSVVERVKVHQPTAVIYLLANLRVAPSAETTVINNAAINTLNGLISGLADNKRTFYLDVNPLFDDGNGYLIEDDTFDGVHVYARYYADWCDWLLTQTVPVPDASYEVGEYKAEDP